MPVLREEAGLFCFQARPSGHGERRGAAPSSLLDSVVKEPVRPGRATMPEHRNRITRILSTYQTLFRLVLNPISWRGFDGPDSGPAPLFVKASIPRKRLAPLARGGNGTEMRTIALRGGESGRKRGMPRARGEPVRIRGEPPASRGRSSAPGGRRTGRPRDRPHRGGTDPAGRAKAPLPGRKSRTGRGEAGFLPSIPLYTGASISSSSSRVKILASWGSSSWTTLAAMRRFFSMIAAIFSSSVPSVTSLTTCTARFWPRR